jgi:hypothetical protein
MVGTAAGLLAGSGAVASVRMAEGGNADAIDAFPRRAVADASRCEAEKSFIEISAPAGLEMFGSNPYAGANRFRFKGFPRCHAASGFSAPCRGSPLERGEISAKRGAGSSGAGTQFGRSSALRPPPGSGFVLHCGAPPESTNATPGRIQILADSV